MGFFFFFFLSNNTFPFLAIILRVTTTQCILQNEMNRISTLLHLLTHVRICRFFVDQVPIRVYKNHERREIPYPKSQPMGIYSTLWEADDWATRGGLEKIDWSKAPFFAYYKDFEIEGCSGALSCAAYQELTPTQARSYRWIRVNHMVYDYCADKSRFPTPPLECTAGI